ncbi:RNA-binding protein [Methyloprofundus sedimenti]|uniref:RNA-binding protein n=1 Tax=Methyloprofundus sedimenti TaxID=1420851 RepID=A0A1V8MAR4_9GAMM|nr:RNA-binding protein [Methyloprofundus sedimenti]OQK18592.1 RNA-binding protein [Methyloprofundus sedimenti]
MKNLKKLFVGNLPASTTENDLLNLFAQFGTVRSSKLITDIFTDQCKGFGFIGMEGHEARAAIAGLNGKDFNGNSLRVGFETAKSSRR